MTLKKTLIAVMLLTATAGFAFLGNTYDFNNYDTETAWPGIDEPNVEVNNWGFYGAEANTPVSSSLAYGDNANDALNLVGTGEPVPYNDDTSNEDTYLCDGAICYLY